MRAKTKHDVPENRNSIDRYLGMMQDTGNTGGVQLDEVDYQLIGRCVAAVAAVGDAIMLSHTRNGRAVRIAVYHGEQKVAKYANSPEELTSLLETLTYIAETS